MILSDEEAKAVQEVARTTGKALDVASGAGTALVNGTVGSIAAATLGIVGGDWVQEQRKRNLAKMQDKTARILDGIAQDRLSAPSPSIVKPLLEAAADESREELQDLWAALLATALVDGGWRVRRSFFEIVRQLEPLDVLLLGIVDRVARDNMDGPDWGPLNAGVAEDMESQFYSHADQTGLDSFLLQVSMEHLHRLSLTSGTGPLSHPTALGSALLEACHTPT